MSQIHFYDVPGLAPLERTTSLRSSESITDRDEPDWPREWLAYTTLFGCFLLMFNSWGLVNTYGTFSSYYLQHLLPQSDSLKLSLIGSTESFIVLGMSNVTGRLLDAGYYRMLTGTGWGLVAIGMFALSGVNGNGLDGEGNYGLVWMTQGLILGLGMACFFVTSSQSMYLTSFARFSYGKLIVRNSCCNLVPQEERVRDWCCVMWCKCR